MTAIRTRLDRLESELSPAGRSVYELTDAELLVAMGLPPDATKEQQDARLTEILGRRTVRGGADAQQP
jgi:hypothetical protein